MPRFFKWVFGFAAFIGGLAIAVNTAVISGGGTTHEWWNDLYPYLLGASGGAAFIAKFTQRYDNHGRPIRTDKEESKNTVLNHDNF